MADSVIEKVREQAELLAKDSKKLDPDVKRVYWFPDEKEVHILEINENTTPSGTGVSPFYFAPDPEEGLTVPSGIAIIRPAEYGRIELPSGWGNWEDAEELDTGK